MRFQALRIACLSFIALPCTLCLAQEQPHSDKAAAINSPANPPNLTLDFPGGPLSKFMTALSDKGVPFSLINPDHLDPALPAFTVHDEHIEPVIVALGRLIESQGYELSLTSRTLAVLKRNGDRRDDGFASFQLASKLGQLSIADITAAINTACEFSNPAQKPSTLRFKYHPGTKLLFIAGPRREIDIASQVIASLPDGPAYPEGRNLQPSASSEKK